MMVKQRPHKAAYLLVADCAEGLNAGSRKPGLECVCSPKGLQLFGQAVPTACRPESLQLPCVEKL